MGFTIKEIKDIIDAPNEEIKNALKERVKKLREKKVHMDVLIKKANKLIEQL